MTRRLRLVSVTVQPNFMLDDGENLEPVPVQPLTVPAAQWGDVVALVATATEQLRAQVEGPLAVVEDESVAE